MKRAAVSAFCCLVAGLVGMPVASAEEEKGSIFSFGGLVFGDFYHVASFHTEAGEGATGLVVRRGYLTLDADFSENLFGRLQFEINQSGEFETYTYSIDFKDFFLEWTLGRQHLLVGLSPTPTIDLIERIWGLRYLVKTPMDLQGVASRNTGIAANGPLNSSGTLRYRAMVGAGLDFGNETSDGAKWMGALTWNPSPGWTIDLYADYEKLTGSTDVSTLQAFVSYEADTWRWGAQYSNEGLQKERPLELASTYAVGRVGAKTSLVGRVDRLFKPSPKGNKIPYLPFDPSAPATFFIAGVEFQVSPRFFITPNTVVIAYDRNEMGVRPKTDFYLRLTLFLNLE